MVAHKGIVPSVESRATLVINAKASIIVLLKNVSVNVEAELKSPKIRIILRIQVDH